MSAEPPFASLECDEAMRSVIARIATGPTQSRDVSREEARVAMAHVLAGRADPVHGALFLIALRMKRESDDEYRGVADALAEALAAREVAVDRLLDLADPFDGYARCLPAAPFLPPLLAACGLPTLSRGLEQVAPKLGTTHRQVLREAGAAVGLTVHEAATRLADPAVGWAYLDQSVYSPALHALVPLRTKMVKRPAITTVERVVGPLRARGDTHIALGYVHRAYPRIYAMLADHAGYASALLVRGVEGGIVPSLRQPASVWHARGAEGNAPAEIDPTALGIESALRAPPSADGGTIARDAAAAGHAALAGAPGPTRDALVLAAALALWHAGIADDARGGAARARDALDSGAAAAHLGA